MTPSPSLLLQPPSPRSALWRSSPADVLRGQAMLQNLPSLTVAHVLAPQPGQRVLDMCAAPGGKTTAIALLMQDRGEVSLEQRFLAWPSPLTLSLPLLDSRKWA